MIREGFRRIGGAFVAVVTGRRSKWAVLALGIALAGVTGPLAGKLTPLEDNSPSAFLPADAASTEVLHYQEAHGTGTAPAIVVYERAGGLRPADQAVIARARAALAAGRLAAAGTPGPVITARNGRAALFSVPIASAAGQHAVAADVKAIRAEVARDALPATADGPPEALRVAVGGPAGSAADAVDAFAGIDSRLLLVTVTIVALLLLVIYRSPLLWLLPLVSVGLAAGWSQGLAYGLARGGFVVNGMTVGILTVLVFGAGTDYALLLTARYREELRRHADRHEAMAVALRRAGPAIAVSALTVIAALLYLLAARLNDIAALGPACAGGIACALAAQLLVLPALLLAAGRRVFWPFVPRAGDEVPEESGLFGRLGRRLARRPRPVWAGVSLVLAVCCIGLLAYRGGVSQQNGFRGTAGSVAAQQILDTGFPAGSAAPATVLVRPPSSTGAALAAARGTPGVASVSAPARLGAAETFTVTLDAGPATPQAQQAITALRGRLAAAAGPGTLVGGQAATNVDLAAAARHDRQVILPAVLAVVLVMLGLLLRSAVASVLLTATVVLSYLASLGIGSVVFRYLFSFPGYDPSVPIFAFVFLVALGIDYNIFLMTRVREEAAHAGTTAGTVTGLAVTGTVITSAGVVLAATFAVLAVLPLIALTEVGFLVAFGVLADTIVVRSVLVPALAIDAGDRWWWPGTLTGRARRAEPGTP